MTLHLLENDVWQVGILPETGASVAFARVRVNDEWRDVLRPTTESDYANVSQTASFIMLPWSNRIAGASFRFRGKNYDLQPTDPEGSARHGATRKLAWQVERSSPERLIVSFDSSTIPDVNFPFRFTAQAHFALIGDDFNIELTLTNTDTRPFPAGFGHHPYFVRDAANAVQIEIPCANRFELVDALAVAAPVPVTPETDFRQQRPLGTQVYEELLTARQSSTLAARITYPDRTICLLADPLFQHVLLFAPAGKPFFAVEPQSNANDGFKLYDQGIDASGIFVLEPDKSQSAMIAFHLEDHA